MTKATDNMRDSVGLLISVIIFFLFMSVIIIWSYNFLAASDDKLFDDNNKYIDSSLANPDVDGNYKDTYENKKKLDSVQINLTNWFGSIKGMFLIFFLALFFIGLILKYRKTILDNFNGLF